MVFADMRDTVSVNCTVCFNVVYRVLLATFCAKAKTCIVV